MDKTAFGRRLNNARKEQGISSEAFSEICGLSAVFVRQIEAGIRQPSLPVFVRICNALKVTPDYLLTDSLQPNGHDSLSAKIRELTPKQTEMITAIIETMMEKL